MNNVLYPYPASMCMCTCFQPGSSCCGSARLVFPMSHCKSRWLLFLDCCKTPCLLISPYCPTPYHEHLLIFHVQIRRPRGLELASQGSLLSSCKGQCIYIYRYMQETVSAQRAPGSCLRADVTVKLTLYLLGVVQKNHMKDDNCSSAMTNT